MSAKDVFVCQLLASGWVLDGTTETETVRIPTRYHPLSCHGKAGGKVTTMGGRPRYRNGEWFVTVGERTTCFFRKDREGRVSCSVNRPTGSLSLAETMQYLEATYGPR